MLTAVNDATTAALCMQRGAMDYLTKPIDLADLARAILRAIRRRDSQIEAANLNQWLKEEVAVRTAELRRERAKLERLSVATLEALVNALEAKDPFIRGHSARVADMGAMIASELGLSDEEVEAVRMAGRLHDIGKIGIREEILTKEGPLTAEEYEQVKQHVVIGSQILAPAGPSGRHHLLRAEPSRAMGRAGLPRQASGRGDSLGRPDSRRRPRSTTPSRPPGPIRRRCPPKWPSSGCGTSPAACWTRRCTARSRRP